jgi:hypothetical protein
MEKVGPDPVNVLEKNVTGTVKDLDKNFQLTYWKWLTKKLCTVVDMKRNYHVNNNVLIVLNTILIVY